MKHKKKLKNRTKFAIAACINIIWYTVACLILVIFEKEIPDALTTCWFAAWTVELALLFGIEIKKKDEEDCD